MITTSILSESIKNYRHIERYLTNDMSAGITDNIVSENTNLDLYLDDRKKFFNSNHISYICIHTDTYDSTVTAIKAALSQSPDVLTIENLKNLEVARAIYDIVSYISDVFVLEIANTEYILVRRDCYSKQN